MKILHLDDHSLYSEGLRSLVNNTTESQQPIELVTVDSAETALEWLAQDADYDLILADLGLPGMDGLSFLLAIKQRNVFIPVMVLSATEDITKINDAMTLGAFGFIPKTASPHEIMDSINRAVAGEICLPTHIAEQLQKLENSSAYNTKEKARIAHNLTKRQVEVLMLIQKGHSNEGIAQILNLSVHTVKSHLQTIMRHLRAKNRTDCLRIAEASSIL